MIGAYCQPLTFLLCAGASPPAPVPSRLTPLGFAIYDDPLRAAIRSFCVLRFAFDVLLVLRRSSIRIRLIAARLALGRHDGLQDLQIVDHRSDFSRLQTVTERWHVGGSVQDLLLDVISGLSGAGQL